MDAETNFDQIENFLAGELAGEALEKFKTRLEVEPALVEQVNLFRSLDIALSDDKAITLQKNLADLGQDFFTKETTVENSTKSTTKKVAKVVPLYKKPWAIAATVMLVATAGGGIWQLQESAVISNDQLFAQNYEIYQIEGQVRGNNSNEELANAYQLYQNKSYENAAEVLALLNSKDIDNQEIMFALANAYLNQNPPKLERAATFFQQLIDMNTSIYVPKAQWYLALINIRQGKIESAKLLLEEVINSGDTKATAAQNILEKI